MAGGTAGAFLILTFLAACGGGGGGGAAIAHAVATALATTFDNSTSGLAADNVKGAIDEIDARVDTAEAGILAHDTRITDNEAAVDALDSASADQDTLISALQTASTDHLTRIVTLEMTSTNYGTRITALENAAVASSSVTYSNTTSGLTATDIQSAIDELASKSAGGSTFIRWGNTSAPTGTTKIYDGVAVAPSDGQWFVMKGGDPGFSTTVNSYVRFMATDPSSGVLPSGVTESRRVVACVCYSDTPTMNVYGTHTAPSGWSILYKGYLLSTGDANIVVDSDNFDASAGAAGGASTKDLRLVRFSTTYDSTNYPTSSAVKACVVKRN